MLHKVGEAVLPIGERPNHKVIGVWTQQGLPGSAFIKPDQLDAGNKDQIRITLLPTISHLQLLNFVSCGRACPSHMTQNLVTVGAKLWTAECFLFDPWSMDQADLIWYPGQSPPCGVTQGCGIFEARSLLSSHQVVIDPHMILAAMLWTH